MLLIATHFMLSFTPISVKTGKELKVSKHLLVEYHPDLTGDAKYECFRPLAVFFKTPVEWNIEVKKQYLEDKYRRKFEVLEQDGAIDIFYDKERPTVLATVSRNAGQIEDNYEENLCSKYLEDGLKVIYFSREEKIVDMDGKGTTRVFLELNGEEDIDNFAADASFLMMYVMEHTNFFKKHPGCLGFYYEDGGSEVLASYAFGQHSDDYLYPDKIAEEIRSEFEGVRMEMAYTE